MSMYWHSLGCVTVLRIWKRPRILMELGVRGRPLLPHTSWGSGEAKKVKAPSSASLRGCMVSLTFTTLAQGVHAVQGGRKIICKKKRPSISIMTSTYNQNHTMKRKHTSNSMTVYGCDCDTALLFLFLIKMHFLLAGTTVPFLHEPIIIIIIELLRKSVTNI